MLEFMGLQRVGHNLVTEQQQNPAMIFYSTQSKSNAPIKPKIPIWHWKKKKKIPA